MARLLLLAIVALLVYVILRTVAQAFFAGLRGSGRSARSPRSLRDHLVKDPVCETYVPRRSAIARTAGADTYYFCSPACAEKFQVPS